MMNKRATAIPTTPPEETRSRDERAAAGEGPGLIRVEGVRYDQWQCPHCKHWGCPASGGSYSAMHGRVRYRKCNGCDHVFKTIVPHDGSGERITV